MKFQPRNQASRSLLALAIGLLASSAALAGPADKVYLPTVEKGETEFELRSGYRDYADGDDEYASVFAIGYGVTNNWKTEIAFEYEGETGQGGKMEAVEWENIVVLTEQGKYWLDAGLFLEYEHTFADGPDELKIGPMFMKEFSRTIANLNLILERKIGDGASSDIELGYNWQVKWRGDEALEWGLQGFGGAGMVDDLFEGDDHSAGPAFFGVKRLASGDKIAYDAALLAGLDDDAPDLTFRLSLEYEMY